MKMWESSRHASNQPETNELPPATISTAPKTCVDCGHPIVGRRLQPADRRRCGTCEYTFLHVVDPVRLALAKTNLDAARLEIRNHAGAAVTTQPRDEQRDRFVYFIRQGPIIKIGISHSPRQRLRQLNIGGGTVLELLGGFRGTPGDEKAVQRKFKHLHVRGDWFQADDDLLAHIRGHADWTAKGRPGTP